LLRLFSIEPPLTAVADGVRVAVRLTPRSRTDRIAGIGRGAAGEQALQVAVTAPPVDDRANKALLRVLAKEWRLPRRDLAIILGAKSRDKIVQIAGDPGPLMERLHAAMATCQKNRGG
jgi:uncharacterized protein